MNPLGTSKFAGRCMRNEPVLAPIVCMRALRHSRLLLYSKLSVACSISAWKRGIIAQCIRITDPPQRPSRTFAIPLAAAARQFPLAHPAVASVVTLMRSTGEVAQNIDLMRVEIAHESGHALQRANLLLDADAVAQ